MTGERATRKLLFVIRALDVGGAERQLIALANGLAARGHRVTVCTAYPGGALAGELDAAIDRRDLGQRCRRDYPRLVPRLRRLIRSVRPDVIHGYLPTSNVLVSLAAAGLDVPVVWGVRASDMDLRHYDGAHRISFTFSRWLARRADLIICNSRAGETFHARHGYQASRMCVIPNGIDCNRFHPDAGARARQRADWSVDAARPVVGVVARLDPMKDHPTLVQAARLVIERGVDAVFVCVGTGPVTYAESLRNLATSLHVGRAIRWVEPDGNIAAMYPAFDVVVSSSQYGEGFSNVLGEAMAVGVSCVSTDVGDARDILGDLGSVVPARDPAALADAIVTALAGDSPTARAARRERIVREFGLTRMIACTENALMSCGAERAESVASR